MSSPARLPKHEAIRWHAASLSPLEEAITTTATIPFTATTNGVLIPGNDEIARSALSGRQSTVVVAGLACSATGLEAMLHCMSPVLAHRDLATRIHVRNGAKTRQTRTDANDPHPTLGCCLACLGCACRKLNPVAWLRESGDAVPDDYSHQNDCLSPRRSVSITSGAGGRNPRASAADYCAAPG